MGTAEKEQFRVSDEFTLELGELVVPEGQPANTVQKILDVVVGRARELWAQKKDWEEASG